MKYFFTTYSPFFYLAALLGMTYLLMERQELSFLFDHEYYTLSGRLELGYAALASGAIWLLYIGQSAFLYSKKLIRIHFISTALILVAMCWYHSQGFEGRSVSLSLPGRPSVTTRNTNTTCCLIPGCLYWHL